jgi:D-glycero-alpha-D-manno-heptose-7-phosphate kinase
MHDSRIGPVINRDAGVIVSRAPVRINDLGGWTDTWFSKTGNVLSTAVSPGSTCRLSFTRLRPPAYRRFTLDVHDFDCRYDFNPDGTPPGRYPLLEASVLSMGVPPGIAAEASLSSGMPPGCGTGTSASVVVALIGAMDRLTPGTTGANDLWKTAHRVETENLGRESGVQDQIAAVYGGTCFIDIDSYPEAHVSPVRLERVVAADLERRLLLVFLGENHRSSEVHESVIERLAAGYGGDALAELRKIPPLARTSLEYGDLERFGALMTRNTECQRSLHRELVSPEADTVIALARKLGTPGWKVNGAGGKGGSLTLLAGDGPGAIDDLTKGLEKLGGRIREIPISLDYEGLSVRADDS